MKRLIVLLGVAGVSLSAVFVRWSTAPSLVLAFYRMAFSVLLLVPLAAAQREAFRAVRRRELLLSLVSGAFLGIHFACYFESLRWTSIAAAVVLVDTEVLFVALASVLLFRKKLGGRAWLAVLLAFGGSVLVALADAGEGGTGICSPWRGRCAWRFTPCWGRSAAGGSPPRCIRFWSIARRRGRCC